MPSKSEKQRRLFGAVVSCKKTGNCSEKIKKISKGISLKSAKDFTKMVEFVSFAEWVKQKES